MRTPTNTYRLQVRASFDLHEAATRLPYLRDLGVDWVYLSPLLEAEPGSDHGYDVVAHDRVDPARGGREGLDVLVAEARRLGLGVLVDIVPNHVGVATPNANAWWWDLLTHGRGSRYAEAFDVDWDVASGRVRIPVLGDDGTDAVVHDAEADVFRYHDHAFPVAPGTTTLDEQHYELTHWTAADDGLNYRRFFAVNTLAGLRLEVPWVFDESHVEIKRWFDEGLVDGLRVDHPDGLRDPGPYLDELAALTGGAYVLVEKILEPGEELPSSWATAGTTGYDVLGQIDRVLTDPAAEWVLPGSGLHYPGLVHDAKRWWATHMLRSEVRRVVRELPASLVAGDVTPGDVLLDAEVIEDAVAELVACFPVYRSYVPDGLATLEAATATARERRPDLADTLDAVARVLADPAEPASRRFEQTSGATMAKGVEDTVFYRYNRLTSLNEVGGDPSHFSLGVDELHAAMAHRQSAWPHAMTTLSTHDTKRGEDVRARITVLSELPALWTEAFSRLHAAAPIASEHFAPLLWQAVLGAWDADDADLRPRLHAYAEKAMREAGDHTTWTEPDEAFEAGVHAAVDAAFDDAEVRDLLDGLLAAVVEPGWSNALAAKAIALTVPGVPDVYQGSELWEQSLVDPDNRRAVDFDLRAALLADPDLDHPARAKLLVTSTALRLRRDRPELFTTYAGVEADGDAAAHVVAFDRGGVVTVATRLPVGLAARGGWGDTTLRLPPGAWRDALTDTPTDGRLADLLATHPVALLVQEDDR
ncbi:malto-oligosyltrehalose synthase [Nocardioides sp. 1609]|uniref:malto-oligosyltrehalose synthase n=1 Tax=Nocardioides sp. 1609 TaxID=2508327 RepID=UPI0010702F5E|nr:malto-oligosyltrehalose synthase [Nocardioides sp. 1609]